MALTHDDKNQLFRRLEVCKKLLEDATYWLNRDEAERAEESARDCFTYLRESEAILSESKKRK